MSYRLPFWSNIACGFLAYRGLCELVRSDSDQAAFVLWCIGAAG